MYIASGVVIAAAFIFGGGTHSGFLGDVLVQLLAIPLLIAAVVKWLASAPATAALARRSCGFLLLAASAVFVLIVAIQLLPLPATWFEARFPATLTESGGERPAWARLSLTPWATWAAAVSAIPIFAVFAGVSQLDAPTRLKLAALVIGLGAVALLLGLLQVAQGPESGLRVFTFTNPSEAVGFFANRNHYAAQLYTVLTLASVWFTLQARDLARPGAYNSRAFPWFVAAAALMLATIAGLAMARSRAGLFLAMASVAGIVVIVSADGYRARSGKRNAGADFAGGAGRRVALLALGFAVVFAALFGLERVLTRFEADPLDDLRTALTPKTLQMAVEKLPFGAGLGSFPQVYAASERTEDLFGGYANRAHNDWAEFLLETGLPGLIIAALFLSWLAMRVTEVWRGWRSQNAPPHTMLQRAATLAIGLILAHSLVDYPLRTTAIATLFAFACALLIEPPEPMSDAAETAPPRKRKRSHHRSGREHHSAKPSGPPPIAPPSAPAHDQDWSRAWTQGERQTEEKD